jgi:hypothetical protein
MDMRLMKSANHFAMLYRRVFSERVTISSFEDMGIARGLLDKAMTSTDAELNAAAQEIAGILGLNIQGKSSSSPAPARAPAASPAPAPSASNQAGKPPTEAEWTFITQCAIKIGGPIGGILINQARGESPASFQAAVDSIASKLGGFGNDFRREINTAKR